MLAEVIGMKSLCEALESVNREICGRIGVAVKLAETASSNGYTTYETPDMSSLTGIAGR
jgi:hypothetical protein